MRSRTSRRVSTAHDFGRTRIAAVVTAVLALAVPALASADEMVVDGRTFGSWTDFFTSDYFADMGKRCGTQAPAFRPELPKAAGGPGDCSLSFTNPAEEYTPDAIYEVTVMIHRLESVSGTGVFPDSLVRTQIDVLNEDFRAIPGTPGEPGTDARIQFKLATTDPDGNPHPGFTRTVNEFWFNDLPDPLNGNYWDALAWDPHRYLNIYTMSPVAPGGVVLGYVPYFPQEGAGNIDDGVRCLWSSFGRTSGNPPYHLGRTVTHEVGHYFGLYHVFQDGCGDPTVPGCYSTGDIVCDTEPDAESHGGCPANSASCGLPDPVRNYLEYTDDACMTNFTPEQARRMRCSTVHYRPDVYEEIAVTAVNEGHPAARPGMLTQNVPNPFGASTEFGFELPNAERATVAVIDVAGRTVKLLASGELSAGAHRLEWNGTDVAGKPVAAGVYFYRLSTAMGAETRRMVMVR